MILAVTEFLRGQAVLVCEWGGEGSGAQDLLLTQEELMSPSGWEFLHPLNSLVPS